MSVPKRAVLVRTRTFEYALTPAACTACAAIRDDADIMFTALFIVVARAEI